MPPTPHEYNNGWDENRKYVLERIDQLDESIKSLKTELFSKIDMFIASNKLEIEEIRRRVAQHDVDLGILKVQAGIWGGIGGLIVVLTSVLLVFLSRFIGL